MDDDNDDLTISRRAFGKTAIGVAALAGGVAMSGIPDIAEDTAADAAPEPVEGGILGGWEVRSLDGTGNNREHPDWGARNIIYSRVAPAHYVDGISVMQDGPNPRYISNRIFNDTGVTLYSPRGVSMWGFVWGQFLDHTYALRLGRRQTGEDGEPCNIPTDDADPLEQFPNPLGVVFMNRSIEAPGTGVTTTREQVNQLSSYLSASAVYSVDPVRLSWMREGPGDGNLANSGARLLMRPGGYLPRRDARGNPDAAPNMVIGAMPDPGQAAVAGDQRANENPMILATQTLFAREHNRIVDRLPARLSEDDKFQIARAVVIAEQQYITYNEFLPALGVRIPRYTGYKPHTNPTVTNEFAAIGYRAHSMINKALMVRTQASRYSQDTVDWLRSLDIQVTVTGDHVDIVAPHGFTTFFQPDLIERLELGPVLLGISSHPMARNDELVVNKIRSLVAPGAVNDLAAVDVARGRDHGFPSYNAIRRAYGLAPKTSFRACTGEESEDFPRDPLLTRGHEIDDPQCVDFVALYDIHGHRTTADADNAVRGVRRTPLAARLKAIYHDVNQVDPFVGMICEAPLPGAELGELQATMWQRQFTAMRDGDRFFYLNNPLLEVIRRRFGIGYETTLGDLIARNSDVPRHALPRNVFLPDREPDAATAVVAGLAVGAGNGVERRPWYCGRAEI